MNHQSLFFSLLIFLLSSSAIQATKYPGYLITLEGDTIKGKITNKSVIKMQEEITFTSKRTGTRNYTPEMIRGVMLIGPKKNYRSLDLGPDMGRKFLLERYADGEIGVYKYFYGLSNGKNRSATVAVKGDEIVRINWNHLATPVDFAEFYPEGKGGIVMLNGDTLTGWLKLKYAKDDRSLKFRQTPKGPFGKIDVETIAGYYVEHLVFTRIPVGKNGQKEKLVFLLVEGDIELFADYSKFNGFIPVPPIGAGIPGIPVTDVDEAVYYRWKGSREVFSARQLPEWIHQYLPGFEDLSEDIYDYDATIDHIAVAELINLKRGVWDR